MKSSTISLQRRRLMIAGAAGVATPAAVFAGATAAPAPGALPAPGDQLVVSGRMLGVDGKPLAGALVESWQGSTTTDADGRFVLMANMPDTGRLRYRVSRDGQMLAARDLAVAGARDEAGVWRAAFGLALV
jgi:protocatechuate 3,4-dioxygenase beta subunit